MCGEAAVHNSLTTQISCLLRLEVTSSESSNMFYNQVLVISSTSNTKFTSENEPLHIDILNK